MKKIFPASTAARKLQLRKELNNIRQSDVSVLHYTLQIKDLSDSLGTINVTCDDDEMVHICLGGLAQKYGEFRTAITTRENPPKLFQLVSYANGRGEPYTVKKRSI